MATTHTQAQEWKQFIGGQWVGEDSGGGTFDDLDPYCQIVWRAPSRRTSRP